MKINPNYAKSYSNLGAVYEKLKQYDKAIDACQHALVIDPDFSDAYHNLGVIYSKLGQCQKALDFYKKSVYLDMDNEREGRNQNYIIIPPEQRERFLNASQKQN